ncbi:MAG: anthranilate synthase component I family protein [Bacteroidetes bacterium]|nr:anthranilate synthase component I family protein [Bacteroidota bacterium]
MEKYKIHTKYKKLLADTFTPVGIYLQLRDKFYNSILLESSDYHGNENSFSFICCKPIATIKVENEIVREILPDGKEAKVFIDETVSVPDLIRNFSERFETDNMNFKFISNGLFGYTTYDSVRYFENIKLNLTKKEEKQIPDIIYSVYQYVIAINHFKNEAHIFEHSCDGVENNFSLEQLEALISNRNVAQFKFSVNGNEESNLTDEQYVQMVKKGKEECKRGNLFQIVLSREFLQKFKGDEFNVYRALRSINPSPYLFYFDYGDFKIFGSSPEAQIVVKNNEAQIHPIAGTFRRTGDDKTDNELAEKLKQDKKETSEHVMLVDLARNDLSRNCSEVKVNVFAETQFYSHVIHLVSKVTGKIKSISNSIKVFADTFPAGTLSGAPKVKAMQIIDSCENDSRGYYGGAIGFTGFNGDFNHAIIIRSFLSKNNKLFYRAGAGVVIASKEENELQEVNNKLTALKQAVIMAEKI